MVRTPLCDKSGMRKGTWTAEEDKKLVAYVTRYGCWNWRLLPKFAGLERCGKSCRLRWMNYLRPNIKRGNYTQEEEDTIITLHQNLGNRWSLIAANLPGRTDNEIKNHWHTVLKKRIQDKSSSSSSSSSSGTGKGSRTGKAKASSKVKNNNNNNHDSPTTIMEQDFNSDSSSENSNNNIGGSCDDRHNNSSLSPQPSSSGFSCITTDTETAAINHEDNNLIILENNNNDYGELGFFDAYDEPVSEDFWTEPYLTDFSYVPPSSEEYFLNPIWDIEFWGQNSLYLE
ncbi:hypothetical protein HN51_043282 [Arachis hypogaea]|uniref:Uncharacterized protein n=1 Tax=Arachis hypogaea TaxID=3818 RepID=A0A444Y6J5_ARAHY|nr:myb-related protein Myb4-like [Arachis ipaensis]XP_025669135.1 transcription factor MYB13 [Arachis hypogaea]QHN95428.1 Myb-related protein [Arachis hypogaea]RYQ97554.1 hypothetical protein Ahy_B08g093632 [Arachis hypogaea]